jgi:hypothetical protein
MLGNQEHTALVREESCDGLLGVLGDGCGAARLAPQLEDPIHISGTGSADGEPLGRAHEMYQTR